MPLRGGAGETSEPLVRHMLVLSLEGSHPMDRDLQQAGGVFHVTVTVTLSVSIHNQMHAKWTAIVLLHDVVFKLYSAYLVHRTGRSQSLSASADPTPQSHLCAA